MLLLRIANRHHLEVGWDMAQSITMGRLYRSTVALKAIMAVTGVAMFGWLLAHMLGNLQIFAFDGGEAFNRYAKFLHDNPALLWGARIAMLGSIFLHIYAAVALTKRNTAARPRAYKKHRSNRSTFASRSMIYTGPIITLWIIFHLSHMTFGWLITDFNTPWGDGGVDVYKNLVTGLSSPTIGAFYVVANLAIGIHLYHGAWSFFQSLGLSHRKYDGLRRHVANGIAFGISGGFVAIALAVMFSVVELQG